MRPRPDYRERRIIPPARSGITALANPNLGAKRVCPSCSTKFFDFGKDPVICPKCGAAVPVAVIPRTPPRPVRAAKPMEEEVAADPAGAELVSLEDADGEDTKVAAVADDDAEIAGDDAADDTFLAEEEEEDDDVADLIDGDIESDEEA